MSASPCPSPQNCPSDSFSTLTIQNIFKDQPDISLRLQQGALVPSRIYDSPKLVPIDLPPRNLHLSLTLGPKIGHGRTGTVHDVTSLDESGSPVKWSSLGVPPLVVKVASVNRNVELSKEAWFYEQLKSLQGIAIPRCYGFFQIRLESDQVAHISPWQKEVTSEDGEASPEFQVMLPSTFHNVPIAPNTGVWGKAEEAAAEFLWGTKSSESEHPFSHEMSLDRWGGASLMEEINTHPSSDPKTTSSFLDGVEVSYSKLSSDHLNNDSPTEVTSTLATLDVGTKSAQNSAENTMGHSHLPKPLTRSSATNEMTRSWGVLDFKWGVHDGCPRSSPSPQPVRCIDDTHRPVDLGYGHIVMVPRSPAGTSPQSDSVNNIDDIASLSPSTLKRRAFEKEFISRPLIEDPDLSDGSNYDDAFVLPGVDEHFSDSDDYDDIEPEDCWAWLEDTNVCGKRTYDYRRRALTMEERQQGRTLRTGRWRRPRVLSIFVIEKLGGHLPLDKPAHLQSIEQDVRDIYNDLWVLKFENSDIAYRNILEASTPGRVCPNHGCVHKWRLIDFGRCNFSSSWRTSEQDCHR